MIMNGNQLAQFLGVHALELFLIGAGFYVGYRIVSKLKKKWGKDGKED